MWNDLWLYVLCFAPGLLLGMYAQWAISSAYNHASLIAGRAGLNGAQTANAVLQAAGVSDVRLEITEGYLSDHYEPGAKVLRLSPGVYGSRSLAAMGVAAHEAGHAIQEATGYPLLIIRNAIVPIASIGGNLAYGVIGFGILADKPWLLLIGVIGFSAVALFQLVNLPVEFDASRRAREYLLQTGLVSEAEDAEVRRVLHAAALTYVAATLTSVLTVLYYLMRYQQMNRRD